MQPNNNLLIVDSRYNGPPGSGNGGWTCGLIGAHLPPIAEVTLRKPPPLDTPLSVIHTDGGLRVVDPAGAVISTAARREAVIEPVPFVPVPAARAASENYPGHGEHHFPTCFVCGPLRDDGLRIFPGRIGDGRTAAIFVTPDQVDPVMIWAALDCPGGWTVIEPDRPWVLGRLAVDIDDLPRSGAECVVTGQAVARHERKAVVRTSLYSSAGIALARGEATWIRLAEPVA
ncbi:hypothetical protein [Allorhizocola rhizosphaerae]|uniref:hypothetical protein n=1 Tax=Allorhizocola rhizosphaerae TaxID=1872709 RepID=UPI000E3DAFA5|nr:hypothetical protein [Allorhizocola rhizosphaerae]